MFRIDPEGFAYAAAAVVYVVAATITWRRRRLEPVVAYTLVLVMLGSCWWALAEAVASAAVDETAAAIGTLLIFPGIGVMVGAFGCLAAAIARPQWRPSRRTVVLLSVQPVVMSVAALTNPWHGTVYTGGGAGRFAGSASWDYGPAFWAHTGYSYTVLGIGIGMVAYAWWTAPRAFRSQRLSLLVAVLVPLAMNVVNLALHLPFDADPTPIAMAVTVTVMTFSIFRQDLFTFTPVARGLILEHISDAIIAVGPMGRVIDVNPAGARLVRRLRPGHTEVIGAPASDLLGAAVAVTGAGPTEIAVTLDGVPAELHVRSSALVDREGRALGTVLVARDVTEVKAQSRRLEAANAQLTRQLETIERLRGDLVDQASRDILTGLHNRRYMTERFDHLLARARHDGRALSVVLLDIDRFKLVNDQHGHLAGDAVLVEAAQRIADAAPTGALVARWGGEEFFVALPGADVVAGLAFAERVRARFEDEAIAVDGSTVPCTVSGGVATFPASGATTAELFHAADLSLYRAKASGRNKVLTGVTTRAPAGVVTAAASGGVRADALVTPSRGAEGPRTRPEDRH